MQSLTEEMSRYARSKLEVEQLVREFGQKSRIAVTILRPSVFLGRYDRHTTPSILRFLRSPFAGLIGEGNNLIPCVELTELADLIVTAAESDQAAGRTYNVSGRQSVSLADLLAMHATEIGRPLYRRYSERTARTLAVLMEGGTRLLNRKSPPLRILKCTRTVMTSPTRLGDERSCFRVARQRSRTARSSRSPPSFPGRGHCARIRLCIGVRRR